MAKGNSLQSNVDEVTIEVTALLVEDIDASVRKFGTYEIVIPKLTAESSILKARIQRKRKIIEGGIKEKGEGSGQPIEAKEGKGKELFVVNPKATK